MNKIFKAATVITLILVCGPVLTGADNWIRDAATGCKLWNPNPRPNETISWFGKMVDGKADGYGIAVWKTNNNESERVAGQWKNGRLEGVAVWRHINGSCYAGEWKDGKKSGYGVYTWPNGTSFLGEYDNDLRLQGRTLSKNGKKLQPIETTAIRQACYRAQDEAIAARKAAAIAEVKNKRQIAMAQAVKQKTKQHRQHPIQDPADK